MSTASLLAVGLRQQALYVPATAADPAPDGAAEVLVANLIRLGFGVSEPLLHALRTTSAAYQETVLATLREVLGLSKNWTPLVRGWQVPTGESRADHLRTWLANLFRTAHSPGTVLPCGHLIPPNTFPLERYNGCPYCGQPFVAAELEDLGQGSKLKVLELWREADAEALLRDLLLARTALDATQLASLRALLAALPLPAELVPQVAMKETRMVVLQTLVTQGRAAEAQVLLAGPTDVLRYLWYQHTGYLQLVEPRTLLRRQALNHAHRFAPLGQRVAAEATARQALRLRYTRREGATVADWLTRLPGTPRQWAEQMHSRRGMWVRFIRALRLAEYARRPGRERLRELLDIFYRQDYPVWQGQVATHRQRHDAAGTLALLAQRPGLFARSLFASMLWFGPDEVLVAFRRVLPQVPARLLFTLAMYAELYFDPDHQRVVQPLGGTRKRVPAHSFVEHYSEAERQRMVAAVADLCLLAIRQRFANQPITSRTMYVAPGLDKLPVPIGERGQQVQDLPSALLGTRFRLQGTAVRLFMQWGQGLPAQHLDMDLSAQIAYPDRLEHCTYYNLAPTGCRHSGDVIHIPDQIGTAEYIELDVATLAAAGAQYVSFVCNAYSNGALAPNLVVGWMDSAQPMRVAASGVAYDPSCVQQQVRITSGLTKGLLFGVLDVAAREITWLEMPFGGQLAANLDPRVVRQLLRKLDSRLTVGQLLALKAEAQGQQLVDTPEAADEAYTRAWAANAAAVTQLLLG
jgi:hypothetical protein